jgi:hypothetical protein
MATTRKDGSRDDASQMDCAHRGDDMTTRRQLIDTRSHRGWGDVKDDLLLSRGIPTNARVRRRWPRMCSNRV